MNKIRPKNIDIPVKTFDSTLDDRRSLAPQLTVPEFISPVKKRIWKKEIPFPREMATPDTARDLISHATLGTITTETKPRFV